MASKVVWYRESWWVRTRWGGDKKRDRRVGPSKADKRRAEEIARKVNGALALGTFAPDAASEKPLPTNAELLHWHTSYAPTMKPTYETNTLGHVERHLSPYFGAKDLREIREEDLLGFIRVKLEEGLAPKTIRNALAVLARVLSIAARDGRITRNPATRLGELMRRVDRRGATEVRQAEAWTREEVDTLLRVASEHERHFYPILLFLLSTGARRGEALGLKWEDVDFERGRIAIRRAITARQLTTPKSGKSRSLAMPPALALTLFDLLAERRRECLARGWSEVPEWVFCSEVGTPFDERNCERAWFRVRRKAQKLGVRPLKLHSARHTYASMALAAGKSVRWVATQLGHSSPMVTLQTYAHAMREEEVDLGFANFSGSAASLDGAKRLYPAPSADAETDDAANSLIELARREGVEPPTLRFEA